MKNNIDRRAFFHNTGLAAMGTMMISPLDIVLGRFGQVARDQTMQRRSLTPTFILEDTLRLLPFTDWDDTFINSFLINHQVFHRGAAYQIEPADTEVLLDEVREKWKSKETADEAQTQLALLAGASLYRLIDSKIEWQQNLGEEKTLPTLTDEAIYYDVVVMKEMQNSDPTKHHVEIDKPLDGVKVGDVAELFHLIRQRNLIRMHTFRPEFTGVELWLDQVLDYQHTIEEENHRYAKIYCDPSVADVHADPSFYHREDEIIRLARGMQVSVTELTTNVKEAVDKSGQQSTYAQALGASVNMLSDWNKYIKDGSVKAKLLESF